MVAVSIINITNAKEVPPSWWKVVWRSVMWQIKVKWVKDKRVPKEVK